MNYAFNSVLMLYLHKILHVTQKDICAAYGGDPATYAYRIKNGTFALYDLVKICNKYHIPISWFIISEKNIINEKCELPTKEQLVYQGEWKPIENNFGAFGVQFAEANGVCNESASKLCGISVSTYYNLFINEEKRWVKINMRNLLGMFNYARVYPGEYIVDENCPILQIEGFREVGYIRRGNENTILDERYKDIIKINHRLTAQIEYLLAEYRQLRMEMNELKCSKS